MTETFFDAMLQQRPDARLVAVLAGVAGDARPPKCRWWARRHKWVEGSIIGKVATGRVTRRTVACRRCMLQAEVSASGEGRFFR